MGGAQETLNFIRMSASPGLPLTKALARITCKWRRGEDGISAHDSRASSPGLKLGPHKKWLRQRSEYWTVDYRYRNTHGWEGGF